MKQGEINQDKKFAQHCTCTSSLQSTSISDITHQSFNSSLMFTITIENLLHFLEYFDDKIISVKNFPLGFVKFDPLIYLLFFVFLHKCGKILKRKDRANILRHLESCHVASKSSLFQVSSFIKCCRRCANGSRSIARVQQ